MKSKIVRILGVVVAVATMTTLFIAAPASADAMAFGVVGTPSAVSNVFVAGVHINMMTTSPDGKTVFAYDATNKHMYISIDGGATFAAPTAGYDITNVVGGNWALATTKTVGLDVSPNYATDKTAVLVLGDAAVTAYNHVIWSANGGSTWVDVANQSLVAALTTTAGTYLSSFDVGNYWSTNALNIVVGVAGGVLGAPYTSNVLKFASGGFSWSSFGTLANPVFGLRFSPNHVSDGEIMAIYTSGATTKLSSSIGGLAFGNAAYPDVQIATAAATDTCTIATATDYIANTGAVVVIGTRGITAAPGGGIIRVSYRTPGYGGTVYQAVAFDTAAAPVKSIAIAGPIATATVYWGLAGQVSSIVYRTTTITASPPTVLTSLKNPTGKFIATNTVDTTVAVGGTTIFAATSGDADTAISSSSDGIYFNQTGLIDIGTVANMSFVDLEAVDANTMFLIMKNTTVGYVATSLFKTTNGGTSWQRILTGAGLFKTSESPAFATDATVCVADSTTPIVQKSTTGGASFIPFGMLATPSAIKTISGGNFYIGSATGGFFKSGAFVSGYFYSAAAALTYPNVYSIAISSKDANGTTIAVGSTAGLVFQSTNGGATFTQVGTTGPGTGSIFVAYGPDGSLYAADSAGGAFWWTSPTWTTTEAAGASALGSAAGLTVTTDGTLYAADATAGHGIWRSLSPNSTTAAYGFQMVGNSTFPASYAAGLALADQAVVSGTTGNTLIVLENNAAAGATAAGTYGYAGRMWTFTDTVTPVIKITSPAAGALLPVAYTTTAALAWTAATSAPTTTTYVAYVNDKADFSGNYYTVTYKDSATATSTYYTTATASGLTPGTTYYWIVKASVPLSSRSGSGSFTTALAPVSPGGPTSVVPINGATDVPIDTTFTWPVVTGATGYQFVIAEDLGATDKFAIIDYSATTITNAHKLQENLKYNTVYWWRVRPTNATTVGDWTVSFFTTVKEPAPVTTTTSTPPVVITQTPPPVISLQIPPTQAPVNVIPSYLLWAVIAVGAVLVIVVIVLIVRTRRIS